jgi:hypothetical protein
VDSIQGSDVVVKVLVVGVGHLGEKWERIRQVGLYEKDYESGISAKRGIQWDNPNKGDREGGWIHSIKKKKKAYKRGVPRIDLK